MSNAPITSRVREQLRKTDDGLTCAQLTTVLGVKDGVVYDRLRAMPDTYIDRWVCEGIGRPAAVWCVVVPPADCPPPEKKRAPPQIREVQLCA